MVAHNILFEPLHSEMQVFIYIRNLYLKNPFERIFLFFSFTIETVEIFIFCPYFGVSFPVWIITILEYSRVSIANTSFRYNRAATPFMNVTMSKQIKSYMILTATTISVGLTYSTLRSGRCSVVNWVTLWSQVRQKCLI